ncbi:hypothetical protein GCM10027072_59390 [Streptomyces bullii]
MAGRDPKGGPRGTCRNGPAPACPDRRRDKTCRPCPDGRRDETCGRRDRNAPRPPAPARPPSRAGRPGPTKAPHHRTWRNRRSNGTGTPYPTWEDRAERPIAFGHDLPAFPSRRSRSRRRFRRTPRPVRL